MAAPFTQNPRTLAGVPGGLGNISDRDGLKDNKPYAFRQADAVAAGIISRLARRCDITRPGAALVADLAGLRGGA